jgi:PAS domain S-box-containing protein
VLLLSEGRQLRVRAEAVAKGVAVDVRLRPDPSPALDDVPETVVTYVARTLERVGIDYAALPHPFSRDPYLARARPQSALCLPLVKQGALVGVLYLENTSTPYAFTSHAAALTVLASAAAMALENSRLYGELEERETKIRTLFDSNLIGIFTTSGWGGAIVEANDAFLRVTGYTREDLAAGRINGPALTPPEWIPVSEQAASQVWSRGYTDVIEKETFRKDGTRVPVLVGLARVDAKRPYVVAFVLDLTDRKRAEEERERARRAEMERESAIATERNRLAAEVHDSLAQGLAMIVMQLADADVKLGSARPLAEKQLGLVRELAIESLSYARRSVNVLRPGIVAGGLPRAIRDVVDSVSRHFAGSMPLAITGDAVRLDVAVESALASIAREALTNAARHSRAARVDTELEYSKDGAVRLVVKDDGAGFDASTPRPDGFGLLSMRERAARAGVELTIITEPGAGTEVVASYSSSTPVRASS